MLKIRANDSTNAKLFKQKNNNKKLEFLFFHSIVFLLFFFVNISCIAYKMDKTRNELDFTNLSILGLFFNQCPKALL